MSIALAFLGFAGCSVVDTSASAQPTPEARGIAPAYRQNPVLGDFMDVCSIALRNSAEGVALAFRNGWELSGPGAPNVFKRGNPASGGLILAITPAKSSDRAAVCEVSGLNVPVSYGARFDQLEVPGYAAENISSLPNHARVLSGTASFGDPIRIETIASAAQGAATISLNMTNLALAPVSQ